MKSQKMRWVLWMCMLTIVGVLAFTDQEQLGDTVIEVTERPTHKTIRSVSASDIASLKWQYLEARTQTSAIKVNLFPSRQLTATKVQTSNLQPTEIILKPSPPTPPFHYLGRLEIEPGKVKTFLTDGKRVYSLMPGEEINNTWRLDRDDPQALHFTYLPMDAQQIVYKSTKAIATEIPEGVTG